MRILVGCKMTYDLPQATPMIATLNVHASRVSDLEQPDFLITTLSVPVQGYRDTFGNWCNRLVAPAGRFSLRTETVVRDSGEWDRADPGAMQIAVEDLLGMAGLGRHVRALPQLQHRLLCGRPIAAGSDDGDPVQVAALEPILKRLLDREP